MSREFKFTKSPDGKAILGVTVFCDSLKSGESITLREVDPSRDALFDEMLVALKEIRKHNFCDADQINETHSKECIGCLVEAVLIKAECKE